MPENTERSDYQCETPKNWITGRLFYKSGEWERQIEQAKIL